MTYRLFKIDSLETLCEDYGQVRGSCNHNPILFLFALQPSLTRTLCKNKYLNIDVVVFMCVRLQRILARFLTILTRMLWTTITFSKLEK